MDLWLGECRKLYQNKIFLMTLALLLAVSGLLCLRMPYERRYGEQREQIDAYLAEYQVSGAAFEAVVRSRVQTVDNYLNSADSRDSSTEDEMPDEVRVAYDTYLADVVFIRLLDSTRKYEPTLEATIETARGQYYNYLQSGRQEDDFIVRYQVGMVNHYTRQLQKNISIPAEIVDGWDVILKDQGYLPFYLASLLILGALLLLPEKSAMLPLLRSTKRGRLSVVFAKCGTAAMLGGGLAALSQALLILPLFVRDEWILSSAPLSSLALVMQNPDMAIQEYLIVCCTVRIVSIMLLSVSVCLLSALFKREIFTLLSVNIVLFFPHILTILGMQKAAYIDFLGVYSCTPLLALKNMSIATLFGYIVVQMAFIAVMSCLVYRHLYSWHLLYRCSSTQPSNNDVNNS